MYIGRIKVAVAQHIVNVLWIHKGYPYRFIVFHPHRHLVALKYPALISQPTCPQLLSKLHVQQIPPLDSRIQPLQLLHLMILLRHCCLQLTRPLSRFDELVHLLIQ